jgi:hypothetical protein
MSEDIGTPEEVLEKAKRLGYDPERYAKEDPKWKSPEAFLDFGEQLNPILRERTKHLEAKNTALEAEVRDIRAKVSEFAKLHEQTQKEAYAKALIELRADRKTALSEGDYDQAEVITDQIETVKKAAGASAPVVQQTAPVVPPEIQATFDVWAAANPWSQESSSDYSEDMETYARAVGDSFVRKSGPAKTADEFKVRLENVSRKVKERFPEKFSNPMRQAAGNVETGDSGEVRPPNKKTYAHLPKESQQACDFLISTGTFKSRDEYLAKYKWTN